MRPRVSPRSVVAGRSGRPCDDGCEVQRVAQLNKVAARAFHEVRSREVPGAQSLPIVNSLTLMQEL